MDKREIYWTPVGEMDDMLACLAIYEGNAKPKVKEKMNFLDFLKLS